MSKLIRFPSFVFGLFFAFPLGLACHLLQVLSIKLARLFFWLRMTFYIESGKLMRAEPKHLNFLREIKLKGVR